MTGMLYNLNELFFVFNHVTKILLCHLRPRRWVFLNDAGLTGPSKTRYHGKVFTCGFDPYMLKKSVCSEDLADYPSVEYPDIVNYLVLQTS